jgi:N-acyl-D-amino-acid deacylase
MDLLVRGGMLVDGTGSKPRRADVRVQGNRISEVGSDLKPSGEKIIDAGGAYVTPGFIDCHTHYDAPMFWMPSFDPLPGYGSTTTVMGNCGLSVAPMSTDPKHIQRMIDVFSYLEDIPKHAFENDVPWSWSSWEGYRNAMAKVPTAANVAGLMGHLNLRIFVMGDAAWERAATLKEIALMAAVLEEGLRHGALGLSTNFFDGDSAGTPVPSRLADEAEFAALFDVMARYPGSVLQFIADTVHVRANALKQIEMMCRLCGPRGVRMQYLLIPMEQEFADYREELMALQLRMRATGADLWALYLPQPLSVSMSFERSLIFRVHGANAWDEVINAPTPEAKIVLMKSADWRERVKGDLTHQTIPGSNLHQGESWYLNNSENGTGPINLTLADYAKQTGQHLWHALADWVIANGTGSTIALHTLQTDEKAVVDMVRYPFSVSGVNDAGAHGQLFCGAGETSSHMLTKYVRDKKLLSIEEMVYALTGKVAEHYSFAGRGVIAPGNFADMTVFALDEIETRQSIKVRDVPNGDGGKTWRYTRPAAPMRQTIVNGEPTFNGTAFTGNLPGVYLSPEKEARSRAAD